jgi:phosphopantothenoylcysteine decarboxylase/phosphopantothenate--cysteine ligase
MAKMAHGHANDLASTLLLATDTPVLMAPAMNVRMWDHPATQRNIATLQGDGVHFVGPNKGDMACGEYGPGRMAEPLEIVAAIETALSIGPLSGKRILVTPGPTHEPIDPVRYIANRSPGAQGTAIARALSALGRRGDFYHRPADVPPPEGVTGDPGRNGAGDAWTPLNAPCPSMRLCLRLRWPIGVWPRPPTGR